MSAFEVAARRLAVLILCGFIPLVHAAPQWCRGRVNNLLVDGSGDVLVHTSFRQDWIRICNVTKDSPGAPMSVCKSWYSNLQLAFAIPSDVMIQYADAPDCGQIPTYSSGPTPWYVQVLH